MQELDCNLALSYLQEIFTNFSMTLIFQNGMIIIVTTIKNNNLKQLNIPITNLNVKTIFRIVIQDMSCYVFCCKTFSLIF